MEPAAISAAENLNIQVGDRTAALRAVAGEVAPASQPSRNPVSRRSPEELKRLAAGSPFHA